ncbi:MAG: hypothetical protein IPM36_04500 [Lewinellaceae bacterium]|nr:hypothetical protein [Lewinellaceae bacterium]
MQDYFFQKRIWITGASSGIGEALAYAFCRSGRSRPLFLHEIRSSGSLGHRSKI